MVADVDNYRSRGYRDVDSDSDSESETESETETSESETETSDAIDAFIENLRRRDSSETLTNE